MANAYVLNEERIGKISGHIPAVIKAIEKAHAALAELAKVTKMDTNRVAERRKVHQSLAGASHWSEARGQIGKWDTGVRGGKR